MTWQSNMYTNYNKRPFGINYDVLFLTTVAAVLFLCLSVSQISNLTRSQWNKFNYTDLYGFQTARVFSSHYRTFLRHMPDRTPNTVKRSDLSRRCHRSILQFGPHVTRSVRQLGQGFCCAPIIVDANVHHKASFCLLYIYNFSAMRRHYACAIGIEIIQIRSLGLRTRSLLIVQLVSSQLQPW
jgi:hypothetical protein